ncbi:MAG TPA: response regulator [Polyangia bacterium]|nr:response regulator [Polyangia bacterium]
MSAGSKSHRVLVVDDNVGLAENIAEILELEGHAAVVATSAEEALAKLEQAGPDVLVTDYRLPGMSGAALVRRLREAGFVVHAIVISAYTDERTIEDARNAGAAFVAKPVDFEALGRLIDRSEGNA